MNNDSEMIRRKTDEIRNRQQAAQSSTGTKALLIQTFTSDVPWLLHEVEELLTEREFLEWEIDELTEYEGRAKTCLGSHRKRFTYKTSEGEISCLACERDNALESLAKVAQATEATLEDALKFIQRLKKRGYEWPDAIDEGTGLIRAIETTLAGIEKLKVARVTEDTESISPTEQRLYDLARFYHRQRHNQDFERCEHEQCILTREVLDIRGYHHRFDPIVYDDEQVTGGKEV
jgi:hypothetical protein